MTTRLICATAIFTVALAPPAAAQPIASDRLEASMIMVSGKRETIPLVEERLHVTIDGQHATTTLLQAYQHDNAGQIEGQYHLRPGSGSKVEGFAYWNGEQKIVGEVFERGTAKRVYENVTSRRRDPGLLEEAGEGAFAFKVFPINPREKKRVELRWTKWLERRGSTVRYRAPITRMDAEIVVSLTGNVKHVKSATHRLRVETIPGGVRLRSEGDHDARPGELALEWQVVEPEWTPSAYVQAGGKYDGWFALALAAPDLPASAVTAKDVTIVIDRSGSMIGEPMENARAAAADMIRHLDKHDRVNVIAFSDEVDPLFAAPQRLDASTRTNAIGFVERLKDGGGTDIALALKTAIASQDRKPGRPRVIVFMTDGQSEADKALEAAKADTGDVRLFTLGLGKAVNRPLLQRLAAVKRGRFVYIDSASAIGPEVSRLAASISKPLLVDVSVEVEGAHAVRLYPRSLPDLFAQDELRVTGRLRGTGTARFIIKGNLAGKPVSFTRTVDLAKAPGRPWVGRLWAQARIEHLLEELALGAKAPELQEEVLELALAYNFVTPYTAFLAIPESELGDQRGTVEAARERKRQIMADNPDVASLDKARHGPPPPPPPMSLGTTGPISQPSPTSNGSPGGDADGAADDEEAEVDARRKDMASTADYAPTSMEVQRKRGGCAGCATGGDTSTGALLVLALAGLLRRRRR
ncbi:MAG: VIT and VWA domain-containing protein [Myxococcota bacterium]|nr:VIT and VWA domain-containing protein [Myxococcota bacterium]